MASERAFVGGRWYTASRVDDRVYPHLIERGFDGHAYWLTGKRGACKLAYWSVKAGNYVIVA